MRHQHIKELIDASRAETVGLAYYDLETNEEFLINPDAPFHAASTMKICVLVELFHQAELGRINLNDVIPIRNEFLSIADGSVFQVDREDDSAQTLHGRLGERENLLALAKPMIAESSNLATNLLVDVLGADNITKYMRELGAEGLLVTRGVEDRKAYRLGLNNEATAHGLMTILVKLAQGLVISRSASDQMIEILLAQTHRSCLPAKLPPKVKIANKPGWNEGICHDAGIFYLPSGRRYVLAVLTRGMDENTEAPELIAEISRIVYESCGGGTEAAQVTDCG